MQLSLSPHIFKLTLGIVNTAPDYVIEDGFPVRSFHEIGMTDVFLPEPSRPITMFSISVTS